MVWREHVLTGSFHYPSISYLSGVILTQGRWVWYVSMVTSSVSQTSSSSFCDTLDLKPTLQCPDRQQWSVLLCSCTLSESLSSKSEAYAMTLKQFNLKLFKIGSCCWTSKITHDIYRNAHNTVITWGSLSKSTPGQLNERFQSCTQRGSWKGQPNNSWYYRCSQWWRTYIKSSFAVLWLRAALSRCGLIKAV